jgi:hypothetical protein
MAVERSAIICISSIFILLLALQLNSVGVTLAFAQLGGPDDENSNLDGIWERIDDDPTEDMVYINQEGTQITATFEPTGNCYEDPYNPTEGTEYAPGKDVFRGNLIGNTIQGEVVICLPEERTVAWWDLNLRVSSDGRTLDGYYTDLDGQQYIQRFEFVSDLPPVSIEINSDRPVYDLNEPVEISGRVTNMVNEESDVLIEVNGPDGQDFFSEAVAINSDGSFSTSFNLNDQINEGTYTAVASHAGATEDITFEVGAPPPPVAPIIVTGATIAAAAGGGGVLLYKKVYVKHTKPHDSGILSTIYLQIECGLENSEVIKRESNMGYKTITGELTEVEQKFSQAINKILENRKKIKSVQKDVDFIKWCREAKEDPNKILSKISEEVIGKFLSSIQPYFQNLMLSQISVESDISVSKDRPKRIKENITFSLNPIQAYIALVVYNNGAPVSSTKFIFSINTYVKIKNLTVYLEKATGHQAQLKLPEQQVLYRDEKGGNNESVGRRRIEIEGLLFGISIELSKIKIAHIEKTIEPPLGLGKKEVEIKKNISFLSRQ